MASLETLAPLSAGLRAALRAAVRREELPARHQLLQPGQVARRVYFVESGLMRGYTLHGGREMSSWFMREGDFVISVVSFLTQAPSTEYLELLEVSVLHSVGHEQLQDLYREFPEFNRVGRLLTERYYVLSEQRAHQLRAYPAAERYARLVQEFPDGVSAGGAQAHCLAPGRGGRNAEPAAGQGRLGTKRGLAGIRKVFWY